MLNLTPFVCEDGSLTKARKQLFVCRRDVMKRLAVLAKKYDGLTGCMFEVWRTSDKAGRVGDVFDFEQKISLMQLAKQFGKKLATPADYAKTIQYRSVDELRKFGF